MTKINRRIGILMAVNVFLVLTLVISNGWSWDSNGYQNISMDRFVEMMEHKDFVLIDVHIPYAGEIPETDLLIPFNDIKQHKNELPDDKNTKIVVYCMSGPMGYVAAEKLVSMGYRRVFHFQGGMVAWKKSGKSLESR
jgi:rhodanese-related sulfurtransferase